MSGAFRRTLRLLSQSPVASSSSLSSTSASTSGEAVAIARASPSPSLSSPLTSHLQPSTLPPVTSPFQSGKTLYEHLSRLPNNGVGTRVRQVKWSARGLDVPFGEKIKGPTSIDQRKTKGHLCYWEVTKARIRLAGEPKKPHGKVWGRLVWRGAQITPKEKEERIRGGLKYSWDAAP